MTFHRKYQKKSCLLKKLFSRKIFKSRLQKSNIKYKHKLVQDSRLI